MHLYNARADVVDPKNPMLATPGPVPGGKLLLNTAAFAQSALGQQGNTGRNALRGPGLFNIDTSLSRSFPVRRLGEAGGLTFRAGAFNFFNHSNLYYPQPLFWQPGFWLGLYRREGEGPGF